MQGRTRKTDFLIIGSGIAGLRAAIELGKYGNVLIVTKDRAFESSSGYAQGGIAVVIGEDDTTDYHIEDTLKAGGGLCKKRVVRVLVKEGPDLIKQLVTWGARFDRSDGRFQIGLEGAHSRRRILHFKDSTGGEIVRVLREKALTNPRISKLPRHFVIDLLIREDRCIGAILLNEESGAIYTVLAKATLLATGGAGQVYFRTSNPPGATGDGIAIAYRGGAILSDMEFVQFHPTMFALPGAPSFLITEALRGEGALLRDMQGKRFMPDYHPSGELAPRDEISRAIIHEMRKGEADYVLLDATHISPSLVKERFPSAYMTCHRYGIDITKDKVPVSPGAHFMMGGIETDTWGRTSINGLFAAGEVACTGVHGANRLASNSLLEGLVFGARGGMAAADYAGGVRMPSGVRLNTSLNPPFPPLEKGGAALFSLRSMQALPLSEAKKSPPFLKGDLGGLRDEIKKTMWYNAGIIRSSTSLETALKEIDLLVSYINGHGFTRRDMETINMLTVSRLIVSSALKRKESVGAHFREDFPQWSGKKRHIRIKDKKYRRLLQKS